MLPELVQKMRSVFSGFGTEPITLGLKGSEGINPYDVNTYLRNGFNGIARALGGGMPAWSGEPVSTSTAMNHSVVYACNALISGSIGFIPAVMMQKSDGENQVADKKPMYTALVHAPNDEITAQCFTEQLTSHCVMQGNGYAQIIRRSGTGVAVELHSLLPDQVYPDREKTGERRLVYVVKQSNASDKTFTVERNKPHDILHLRGLGWDGVQGYSVITMGRQSIGTAIAAEHNVARFWANGGRVPYILKLADKFETDEDFQKFRVDWEAVYSSPHRTPIIEPPIDEYKQIGLSMVDAQALETRVFTIAEICRWFQVWPHLVGDLSRATFNNIEHLAQQFVTFTLSSWMTRWEQELWRCVLTPEEKTQGYFWRHDVNALLRGDFQSRMAGYATALQNGHLNVDEVRGREGLNPLPEGAGQNYHIQLNMQSLPGGDQPLASQTAQLVRLTGNKERKIA